MNFPVLSFSLGRETNITHLWELTVSEPEWVGLGFFTGEYKLPNKNFRAILEPRQRPALVKASFLSSKSLGKRELIYC